MKKIIYNSLFFLLPVCCFVSCTKEITADVKDLSGNPVINCFLHPDTAISVQVTKSHPILGPGATNMFAGIENATVKVYEDGVEHILAYDSASQRYGSGLVPMAGKKYSVKVNIVGFEKEIYAAEETVLAPITLSSFSTDTTTANNKLYLKINFSIDDPIGPDYYHVILKFRCKSNGIILYEAPLYVDSDLGDNPTGNSGSNSIANVPFEQIYPYGGFMFNDQNVDGKKITFSLPTSFSNLQCDTDNDKELYVEVRKASKAYHDYVVTVSNYMENSDNPFGTPIQIYNNIENGRGIWATYSKSSITREF